MKNIYFYLIIFSFISCSKNDDSNTINQESIYGKWYYKNTVIDGQVYPYDDHEACGKDYIEFYDTNKVKSVDIWDCSQDVDWEATFVFDNDMLIINNGTTSTTYEVVDFTSTNLSFTYKRDINEDGIEETFIKNFDR